MPKPVYQSDREFCTAVATLTFNAAGFSGSIEGLDQPMREVVFQAWIDRLSTVFGKLPILSTKDRSKTTGRTHSERIDWKRALSDEDSPLGLSEIAIAGIIRFYGPFIDLADVVDIRFGSTLPCKGSIESAIKSLIAREQQKRAASAPSA